MDVLQLQRVKRYFAAYNVNGTFQNVGIVYTSDTIPNEITAEEYERLRQAMRREPPKIVDPVDEALEILRGEVTENE